MKSSSYDRRRAGVSSLSTGVVVGVAVTMLIALAGTVSPPASARADSTSAVTVTAASQDPDAANAPFPKLEVTVSQSKNLVSQGIQISWKNGKKSTPPSGQTGGEDFLQIAQCGGEDPENPGQPDRTTCQYGAFLTPGAKRDSFRDSAAEIAPEDVDFSDPGSGFFNPPYTSIPFRSATGETVASVVDHKQVGVNVNTNQFFTQYTSNEISWAGSGNDGTGSAKFEVQTAVQSPGLGCGSPVTAADASITGQSCWLVIIPRGTKDIGAQSISKSGLFWDSWKHRLAVKLDFLPIGAHCAIGAVERQLAGSELIAGAVSSWQPRLCNAEGGAAYSILTGSESDAAAAANGTVPAPLALTSRALASDTRDALAYAPIALTGLAISFAIDREPNAGKDLPAEVLERARLPFDSLNLTPRLVAKLLSNSYLDSLPYGADRSHLGYISAAEPGPNPRNITLDPDFLAINDAEWADQAIVSPSLSDLLVPQGRSDGALALWTYVMSDPDAVDFLAGEPDQWGMTVNPWSSTDATVNPSKAGLQLPRDSFPKTDPVEQEADGAVLPINLVTWRPYTNDLDTSAYLTLRGDGQVLGGWDPQSVPAKYSKTTRSLPGSQRVLGLTDTSSAEKFQVISAALLNPAGKFVAPTTDSLTAAAAAMTASSGQLQVYGFDPSSKQAAGATNAYPLALPVYAAVNPGMKDPELRASYAAFIRYAAADGQTPGTAIGELPAGYAPIPPGWRTQALGAAQAIESGLITAPTTAPTTAPSATGSAASQQTPTAPAVQAPSAEPVATGAVAGPLLGTETPSDPETGALAAAVPGGLLAGLGAAAGVPVLSRIRRRS